MHTRIAGGCLYHASVALGKPINSSTPQFQVSKLRRAFKLNALVLLSTIKSLYHPFMIKSIVTIDTIQGDNMYFKRLRDLREDHDMKQIEVAEYLGIQQTVYSRYERGFQSIPVEHLIKLADLYKVSTDYILGRK